ncbi:HK97-gp10 family putative phage morphogenesis protein [Flavobacterium sp.]|jgi:HK97 gp10 family phage protein|uniref:HK97-gp10 family putative phage morphogenesis protein n=1 Tax=Flavobacterium sp. TaxID=239 RepID=UPI0037BF0063
MASTIQIKGLKELDEVLKSLPQKIEQNVMRGAMRAGQKVILDNIREKLRSNGSIQSGELEKSLRIRFDRRAMKRGWINSKIVAGNELAYYAHMVEFGTAAHFIKIREDMKPKRQTRHGTRKYSYKNINKMVKRGSLVIGKSFVGESVSHPGARPKPFMRPALDESHTAAIEALAAYIRNRLPKELKKAGRA